MAAMSSWTVPNHKQLAIEMTQEMLEERNDLGAADRASEESKVEVPKRPYRLGGAGRPRGGRRNEEIRPQRHGFAVRQLLFLVFVITSSRNNDTGAFVRESQGGVAADTWQCASDQNNGCRHEVSRFSLPTFADGHGITLRCVHRRDL